MVYKDSKSFIHDLSQPLQGIKYKLKSNSNYGENDNFSKFNSCQMYSPVLDFSPIDFISFNESKFCQYSRLNDGNHPVPPGENNPEISHDSIKKTTSLETSESSKGSSKLDGTKQNVDFEDEFRDNSKEPDRNLFQSFLYLPDLSLNQKSLVNDAIDKGSLPSLVHHNSQMIGNVVYVFGGLSTLGSLSTEIPKSYSDWKLPLDLDISDFIIHFPYSFPLPISESLIVNPYLVPNHSVIRYNKSTSSVTYTPPLKREEVPPLLMSSSTIISKRHIFYYGGFELITTDCKYDSTVKKWRLYKEILINHNGYILDTVSSKFTKISLRSKNSGESIQGKIGCGIISNEYDPLPSFKKSKMNEKKPDNKYKRNPDIGSGKRRGNEYDSFDTEQIVNIQPSPNKTPSKETSRVKLPSCENNKFDVSSGLGSFSAYDKLHNDKILSGTGSFSSLSPVAATAASGNSAETVDLIDETSGSVSAKSQSDSLNSTQSSPIISVTQHSCSSEPHTLVSPDASAKPHNSYISPKLNLVLKSIKKKAKTLSSSSNEFKNEADNTSSSVSTFNNRHHHTYSTSTSSSDSPFTPTGSGRNSILFSNHVDGSMEELHYSPDDFSGKDSKFVSNETFDFNDDDKSTALSFKFPEVSQHGDHIADDVEVTREDDLQSDKDYLVLGAEPRSSDSHESDVANVIIYVFGGFFIDEQKKLDAEKSNITFSDSNDLIRIELIVNYNSKKTTRNEKRKYFTFNKEALVTTFFDKEHKGGEVWPSPRGFFGFCITEDVIKTAPSKNHDDFENNLHQKVINKSKSALEYYRKKVMIVHGGTDSRTSGLSDFYMFHFSSGRWTKLDQYTHTRNLNSETDEFRLQQAKYALCFHQIYAIGNYILFLGGLTDIEMEAMKNPISKKHHILPINDVNKKVKLDEKPDIGYFFEDSMLKYDVKTGSVESYAENRLIYFNLKSQTFYYSKYNHDMGRYVSSELKFFPHLVHEVVNAKSAILGGSYLCSSQDITVIGGQVIVNKFCSESQRQMEQEASERDGGQSLFKDKDVMVGGILHYVVPMGKLTYSIT